MREVRERGVAGATSPVCWKWLPAGAARHSLHCFIVWIVFENALDTSARSKAEELEGRVEELDARGLRTVGVFVIIMLVWEHAKEGREAHAEEK